MEVKVCTKCSRRKSITEFNFKVKSKGRRNAQCQACTRKSTNQAYYKRREYYMQLTNKWKQIQIKTAMKFLYQYLRQHPCVDCGINNPVVLHFDHVRGKKKAEVSVLARGGYRLATIMEEVEKCEIRCANCHAIKTARDRHYYRYVNEMSELPTGIIGNSSSPPNNGEI